MVQLKKLKKLKKRLTPPDGESRRRVSHHYGALLVTTMVQLVTTMVHR